MKYKLTKKEAIEFFTVLYGATHHIPSKLTAEYDGYSIIHNKGDLSTYDYDFLTRMVFMAHDRAIRLSINPIKKGLVKISIFKKSHTADTSDNYHPKLADAICKFQNNTIKETCHSLSYQY